MRAFTSEELRQYNGLNGAPAYVAFEGRVYDVSASYQWQNGRHQVAHGAGEDLTDGFDQAPHGADLLEKFPMVGVLREARG